MNCYLCGQPRLEVIRTKLRNNVNRRVFQCASCELNYLEPEQKDFSQYYRDEYRKTYSPVVGEKLGSREIFEMYLPFQEAKLVRIQGRLNATTRLLDVGCSAGHFLYHVRPLVGECMGIEFNQDDALFVNDVLGIRTYTTPIEQTPIPEGYFDVITAFHVVEHVADPIELLNTLRRYLKPEGLLYVEVPNVNDALLSVYDIEDYASFWYREPHIFNFSPRTLMQVMTRAGFIGEIRTTQAYNFVNHFHWMMVGGPQKNARIGMGSPDLPVNINKDSELARDLQDWARNSDLEYRQILGRHMVGDTIVFVGRMSPS